MRLSHSQMETWQQCQLKWAHGKIYGSPRAPSEALILGTAFHAALELDGREWMAQQRHLPLADLWACGDAQLRAAREEVANDLVPTVAWQMLTRRCHAMLQAFVTHVQPHYAPVAVETDLTVTFGSVQFSGRIDAITARAIVDWKTASKPWPDDAADHKDQASAYLAARPDQNRVTFIVFANSPHDPEVVQVRTHVATRTPAQISAYSLQVQETAASIESATARKTFDAAPTALCGWCEFLGSCPIGQEWLRAAGRRPSVPLVTR